MLVVARADEHRFGDDLVGHVAQPHQPACGAPQRLQPFEQGGVGVELVGGLATGDAEVAGSDDHQRHGGVEAGDLDAVDDVDALPGREDRAGDRAPGVEEVQPDRRRGAGHAVDPRIARVGDPAAGSLHGDVDARAGVDVVDAHRRGAVGGRYEPLLDRERADARQHVAAVGAGVHRPLADPDLGEQVVHVAAGLRRTARRWPPCWSACCPRRRRRAAAGRRRRWRRSGPRRGRARRRAATRAGRTGRGRCLRASARTAPRGRRRCSWPFDQPVEHAVDHDPGLAEVVRRVAELGQRVAVEVLADLRVLGQQVEQRAAGGARRRGRCRRPGRGRTRGRCRGPGPSSRLRSSPGRRSGRCCGASPRRRPPAPRRWRGPA